MTRAALALRCAAILYICTVSAALPAFASKTDDALATALAQLAESNRQRDKAATDAAALQRSLDKLTLQTKTQTHTAEASATNIQNAQTINDDEARRVAAQQIATAEATARHADAQQATAHSDRVESREQTSTVAVGVWSTFAMAALTLIFPLWWKRRIELQDIARAELNAERDAEAKERSAALLAAVHAGRAETTQAIATSNHLTQKIVDMREDLVSAVAATATALKGKEDVVPTVVLAGGSGSEPTRRMGAGGK